MKQFFSVLFLFVFVSGFAFAQDAMDLNPNPPVNTYIPEGQNVPTPPESDFALLYDNGPLITHPTGGLGGNPASAVQTALSMTLYGFGAQLSANNSMADNFTVTGAGWSINEMQFFTYQTNSGTTSTINDLRVQIWNGAPNGGGSVIWGDMTTNRMTSTSWTTIYRVLDTDLLNGARPVMRVVAQLGTPINLGPGTYWVQFQFGGTGASGPWAPPVTVLGQTGSGNALQSIAGVWGQALDGTFPQDVPFMIYGTAAGSGYFENFEGFIAGQQVACQDPVNWTTWSNLPCDAVEDAYISSNYAYSGTKSAVIHQNNDLVHKVDNSGPKTSGKWYISFMTYIPAGKTGYFNTLALFNGGSSNWGMECYFNAGGAGSLNAGSATPTAFTWIAGSWQMAQVIVNLNTDQAEFWYGATLVKTWQWTLGANGGGSPLSLDANDFFGATANDEMYFDDYRFSDTPVPVELTSFTANVNNGVVQLNWETATEINNQGFEIQRRTESSEFRTIGFIDGYGTTTEPKSYSYLDRTADNGINYYRLKQVDYNGTYAYSDIVEVDITAPLTFNLDQNYPNPFNPSTSIKYSVPESGNIRLSVFNIVGEEVAVLVNGFSQAGSFEVTFDASNLSTGVYLYKLQSANSVQTKKMMLLK
jgi:hypothetical protein